MGLSFKKVLGGSIGGLGGMGMLDMFGGGGDNGLQRLLEQMKRQQALRYTQAEGKQLQGLDALRSGYDEALQNVGRTGLASKMNIEGAGKRATSSAAQRMTNAGLSGTTLGAQIPGMYQGQTAAALAGVDQAVAAAKGGLLTSRGHAMNNAYGGLSQLAQNRLGSEMQLGGLAWNNIASQPSDSDQMMQLMGMVGQFLPMAFGMPPIPGGMMMSGGGSGSGSWPLMGTS